MNEIQKEVVSTVEKEVLKTWLKNQMSTPYDSYQRRCEIDQMVEQAASCADFIVDMAKMCNIDLDRFVRSMFGLR